MGQSTHDIASFIWYIVRSRTTFNLHTDNTRLVHDVLDVVTVFANYFA